MTTIDEKEILEIEKLKGEIAKLPLEVQKIMSDMKQGNTRNIILAVGVTAGIVSAFFKIVG